LHGLQGKFHYFMKKNENQSIANRFGYNAVSSKPRNAIPKYNSFDLLRFAVLNSSGNREKNRKFQTFHGFDGYTKSAKFSHSGFQT